MRAMTMFHVVVRRSGPDGDPERPLEEQSGWDAHAAFMDGLVDTVEVVEDWTIRLDGTRR